MKVIETTLPGVIILEPKVFPDGRGYFLETWSKKRYEEAGIEDEFVQDNVSVSEKGVLRGLHFQCPQTQGKLVQVLSGEAFDVAVDIRTGSPTFGQWTSVILSEANHKQLYISSGFAHGFCVLSESAAFSYKCTDYYNLSAEGGVIFNDPDIDIDWPVKEPNMSEKDSKYPRLKDIPVEKLPKYKAST
ncbi:MAG: dTDP-4-dehydrorhamnose 3,5-epimerase [Planctomycetes bacterium]|nr:dTDP-4-dehydrorhamnose 3,5-epimerase [Planctomycetota bacterium]